MLSRDQINKLITVLDRHLASSGTDEARDAWTQLRGELRRSRRQSEQFIPATAIAVQHAAAARDHAERVLDALGEAVRPDSPKDE